MNPKISFNSKELSLINDPDILLRKKKIQEKIFQLLKNVQSSLSSGIKELIPDFPFQAFNPAKISKGENYLNLPYMVLDFPSRFNRDDIIAFRTMFYWGHFFSTTIHLQGKSLEQNRERLTHHLEQLIELGCYVSTGRGPWQYHYNESNYCKLSLKHAEKLKHDSFIKLSVKFDLTEFESIPSRATEFHLTLLKIADFRKR